MSNPLVDAKGKLCPVPLVMTKKVYDELSEGETMTVLVDNDTSAKNVQTFILESGGKVKLSKEGEVSSLEVVKGKMESGTAEDYCTTDLAAPHIVYLASDQIGTKTPEGEELGIALMKAFLGTLKDVRPLPSHLIFIHEGVKLLVEGTKTESLIAELKGLGVQLVACGTCLDYFGLMDKQSIAKVSNMYDILSLQTKAGKILKP